MDGLVVFFKRVTSYHTTEVIAHRKAKGGCHGRVQSIGNICILSTTSQTPFITNCLVTIVHTKPVNSNFSPKIGCHGNVPQHLWTPSNTWFLWPIRDHNPNGIHICSAVFAQMTVECPYTLQWDAHSPPKICRFQWGDLEAHLIHGSPGPPKSSTQMAAVGAAVFAGLTSVTDRQTNRQTDRPHYSVGKNRPHLRT